MSGANDPQDTRLHALHGALCDHFAKLLVDGEEHVTKEGEVVKTPPSAATLRELRQFLKDNEITSVPGPKNPMGNLVGTLPRFPPSTNKG